MRFHRLLPLLQSTGRCATLPAVYPEPLSGPYAEAAHIRPLGVPHNGPDSINNLLCLCPNHHVALDKYGYTIADDRTLIGIDGELTVDPKHKLDSDHVKYHREQYELAMRGQ